MAGTDINVNYDDERFAQVKTEKDNALTEIEGTYDNMIGQSDKFYQQQIDASQQWADEQIKLQKEQTAFTIDQIEQQKAQANKDYLKEQAASYVDWQKQSNPYGAEAEKLASAGLTNTGYSESSQVSMYNTYQNRVATAREVIERAKLNFDNKMTEARLQNNAVLAEIYFTAYKEQAELALQGFQYKNTLVLDQANKKMEVDQMYYNRYQDVLQQINHENAMAEEIRQFNQNYQLQVEQFNKEYDLEMRKFDEQIRQFDEEMARLKKKDEQEHQLELDRLQLQKDQLKQQQYEFKKKMEAEAARLKEEKRQFDATHTPGGTVYTDKGNKGSGGGIFTKLANFTKEAAETVKDAVKYPVNMQSVMSLGYGPINEKTLAEKTASGEVSSYVKNGQTYFVRNNWYDRATGRHLR